MNRPPPPITIQGHIMIDDLISRLQRTVPTTGHIARMGSTEYRINPDGPEAAEALILLRDALEYIAVTSDDRETIQSVAALSLSPIKIEKAEQ